MPVAEKLRNGEEVSAIIGRFILLEAGLDFFVFLLVKGIISLMFSGQVFRYFGVLIYSAAVLVSCMLYSYYAFFRWEKLFTGDKKPIGVVKYAFAAVVFFFAVNQFLTNLLNDQLVQDMKTSGSGKWFREEMDRHMNYLQPSPENAESARNARKLIEKYQKYVDEVINIANERWGLRIE